MSNACRTCGQSNLERVIDLGNQPWCNHFLRAEEVGHEPIYPLRVVYCHDCQTAQLDYTVPKEVMFGDHTYLSGITQSLSDHFKWVAAQADSRLTTSNRPRTVLDIGSNDGTQLKHFRDLGYDVLGVESSRTTAKIAVEAGINTVNTFFNEASAAEIGRTFDVINAAGVFFHLEELHSVTEAIRTSLQRDGVFVVQFLYMKRIMEICAFDQIYHEHLLYYTLQTIQEVLGRHGLELFDATLRPIHGGSIVAFATHQGARPQSAELKALLAAEAASGCNKIGAYQALARRIERLKIENIAYLERVRSQGKSVYGMGAPVKGNTLINYFGLDKRHLDCLVERNTLRKGLFSPGAHLPILIESELPAPPDVYYVLAWNFKREILARNQDLLGRGVEFYFPIDPDVNLN